MFEKLEALQKVYDEAMTALRRDGEAALKASFVEFFAAYPEVEAIKWQQYTPYFNDGEACYFGVREPEIKLTMSDEFKEMWAFRESSSAVFYADVQKLSGIIQSSSMESVLKAVFGDHSEITVYPDRIDVETCDHE
jgi:hypothetical protein